MTRARAAKPHSACQELARGLGRRRWAADGEWGRQRARGFEVSSQGGGEAWGEQKAAGGPPPGPAHREPARGRLVPRGEGQVLGLEAVVDGGGESDDVRVQVRGARPEARRCRQMPARCDESTTSVRASERASVRACVRACVELALLPFSRSVTNDGLRTDESSLLVGDQSDVLSSRWSFSLISPPPPPSLSPRQRTTNLKSTLSTVKVEYGVKRNSESSSRSSELARNHVIHLSAPVIIPVGAAGAIAAVRGIRPRYSHLVVTIISTLTLIP